VVAGQPEAGAGVAATELERILKILLRSVSAKEAATVAAEITGTRKREAYQLANRLRDQAD
jgi:hypothetical protein